MKPFDNKWAQQALSAFSFFDDSKFLMLRLFILFLCGWCGVVPAHAALHSSAPNTPAKSGDFRAYFRDPYHNPETGRFWTQDSYEGNGSDPSSLHKYSYCGDNPVNCTDPTGQTSLAEVQTAQGIDSRLNLRTTQNATRGLRGKIWDLFIGAETTSSFPFMHSFMYAKSRISPGLGFQYDVGLTRESMLTFGTSNMKQKVFGTFIGVVHVSEVSSPPRGALPLPLFPGLNAKQFLIWNLVTLSLGQSLEAVPYRMVGGSGTINCFKWTAESAITAYALSVIP